MENNTENKSLTVQSSTDKSLSSQATLLGSIGIQVKTSELCHGYKTDNIHPGIVIYSDHNGIMAVCNGSGKVQIWDIKNFREPKELDIGENIKKMALSTDGSVIALCDMDNKISAWKTCGNKIIFSEGMIKNVNSIAVSNEGSVACAFDDEIGIFQKKSMKFTSIKKIESRYKYYDVCFDQKNECLAAKLDSGEIFVFSCKNHKEITNHHFNDAYMGDQAMLSFNGSGDLVSARRNYIDIVNIASGEYLGRHILNNKATCVTLSDDSLYCAAGTDTGEILVINISCDYDDKPIKLKVSGRAISSVFFSAIDKRLVAYCADEGKVYFWDPKSAEPVAALHILEKGFLWTTTLSDIESKSGWFWTTDRLDLIDVKYKDDPDNVVAEKTAEEYKNNFNRRDIIMNKIKNAADFNIGMLQIEQLRKTSISGAAGELKLLEKF